MTVIVTNPHSQYYMMSGTIISDSGETVKVQFLNESEPVFFFKSELGQVVGVYSEYWNDDF